jgi:hypothetical protein
LSAQRLQIFISGPELQNFNIAGSSGEQAPGDFSRELASRSLSPIRPLPATCEPHFRKFPPDISSSTTTATFGPVETSAGEGQKRPGEGIQVLREFYRQESGFAQSGRENLTKIKSESYENSTPFSSPFSAAASAASGVKSDDKCAPASNIKPEMNAQNIRATEMENACP